MLHTYAYRRKLPHYQPDNKVFFITFCTYRRRVLPEAARTVVLDSCLAGIGKQFDLYGAIVMPDHVHLLLTPLGDEDGPFTITQIMQTIKGASAHRVNKFLARKGKVWQEESFDRALRREERVGYRLDYMLQNPVRAGLAENPLDYRWLWRNTGASM
jgi:putative transposase